MPHKLCLHGGWDDLFGFPNDSSAVLGHDVWRIGSGNCDCNCETCKAVHDDPSQRTFYIYRYLPTGRQVAKVTIVADGTEGMA